MKSFSSVALDPKSSSFNIIEYSAEPHKQIDLLFHQVAFYWKVPNPKHAILSGIQMFLRLQTCI